MAQRTLPGLGLTGFWDLGFSGWKDKNDVNLRIISALLGMQALDLVATTPGAPVNGDIYMFAAGHPTQANKLAIYDLGAWVYLTPLEGAIMYDMAVGFHRTFDGAAWVAFAAGGGATLLDELGDVAAPTPANGQVLTWVDGDTAWKAVNPTGSGGGSAWLIEWSPLDNEPPTADYATIDTRNSRPVLDFDATTQEGAIFTGVLPFDYGGLGVTIKLFVALTTATTGTAGWVIALERTQAVTEDIDSDYFGPTSTVAAVAVPSTSGHVLVMSVNISNGANMDDIAPGEIFRIRIRRDVANDTAPGDAELLRVVMVSQ